MTLMDLSRRSGVAASTISRIENRQTSPTFTVLMKIEDGLSVPVSTLLAGPGPRFAPGCRPVTRAGTGTRLETAHGSSRQIGRASCGERVCKYVEIHGGAGTYKKKKNNQHLGYL